MAFLGSNNVVQSLTSVKTDTFAYANGTYTDVGQMSVTITPKSSSSQILVMVHINCTATYYIGHVRLMRGSTEIGNAAAASNRNTSFISYSDPLNDTTHGHSDYRSMMFLDSPSTTSATTYKIQARERPDGESNGTFYINRSATDRNNSTYDSRGISAITVMEIA